MARKDVDDAYSPPPASSIDEPESVVEEDSDSEPIIATRPRRACTSKPTPTAESPSNPKLNPQRGKTVKITTKRKQKQAVTTPETGNQATKPLTLYDQHNQNVLYYMEAYKAGQELGKAKTQLALVEEELADLRTKRDAAHQRINALSDENERLRDQLATSDYWRRATQQMSASSAAKLQMAVALRKSQLVARHNTRNNVAAARADQPVLTVDLTEDISTQDHHEAGTEQETWATYEVETAVLPPAQSLFASVLEDPVFSAALSNSTNINTTTITTVKSSIMQGSHTHGGLPAKATTSTSQLPPPAGPVRRTTGQCDSTFPDTPQLELNRNLSRTPSIQLTPGSTTSTILPLTAGASPKRKRTLEKPKTLYQLFYDHVAPQIKHKYD